GNQNVFNLCGVTAIADTTSGVRSITFTYNGSNCSSTHLRTGTVVASMPAGVRWKNAGAVVTVSFQDFKITRIKDSKSITINGTQMHTNVSGGLVSQLSTQADIIHTVRSNNMSLTFNDNTQRTWQVARRRVFTYNNGIVVSSSGIGTSGTITNAAEWGTNRFGRTFTTSIIEPLIIRQDCSWRLTSGKIKHEGFAALTVHFGLNASGSLTTCPGTGNYYYTLTWTGPGGNSRIVTLPY
ncbi:MAG TPA: hypothetical protein VM884_07010, partial [Flavisolibacter sp.]|nr:hypothetical protein [Flavisolibacter sp.]